MSSRKHELKAGFSKLHEERNLATIHNIKIYGNNEQTHELVNFILVKMDSRHTSLSPIKSFEMTPQGTLQMKVKGKDSHILPITEFLCSGQLGKIDPKMTKPKSSLFTDPVRTIEFSKGEVEIIKGLQKKSEENISTAGLRTSGMFRSLSPLEQAAQQLRSSVQTPANDQSLSSTTARLGGGSDE